MEKSSTLVGENVIVKQLRAIAAKLTGDAEMQRDLMQEMFVHLVRMQTRQPDKTPSWHLKGCEFHARNYLKRGRSIDSPKRAKNGVAPAQSELTGFGDVADPVDLSGEIITRDLVERLQPHLSAMQKRVLVLLSKGCGVREAARELGITHAGVIKHRKKIARIAHELFHDGQIVTTSSGSGALQTAGA
jgi:DNA-directed RNA polymerase specialized sigma24 family protein